jgi:hypothetical protein
MFHLAELQANRPGGTELGCHHVLPTAKDLDEAGTRMTGREAGIRPV